MFTRSCLPSALTIAAVLASAASAQVTRFGAACPGSVGLPSNVLRGGTSPTIGTTMTFEVGNVPAGAPTAFFLGTTCFNPGIDLSFLGMTGCSLYLDPFVTPLVIADAAGLAALSLTLPFDPGLLGVQMYEQGFIIDPGANPLGLISTDALCVRFDAPPVILAGPTGVIAGGGLITIQGTGFGNGPDDLCIGGPNANGEWALFLGETLTTDPQTGVQTLTARLVSWPENPIPQPIGLFRGTGARLNVAATPRMTAPGTAWAWESDLAPQAGMAMAPVDPTGRGLVTPTPPGGAPCSQIIYANFRKVSALGIDCIVVDIPWDPCGTGAGLPDGATLTSDVHYNVACPGQSGIVHYDDFLQACQVVSAAPGGSVFAPTVAAEHASQIQAAFDAKYGPGLFSVTGNIAFDTGGNPVGRITIKTVDPTCTISGVGGKIIICCP